MRGGALPTARHVGVAPSIVNNNPETMERSRRSFPTAAGWFFRPRHGGFSWAKMSQTPLALILRDARTRVRALRHLFSPCARRMRTGESAARRRTVFGHFHLTMSNSHSRSRGAFLRPGFASLLRAPAKRVGGAPKNVRVLGGTPVGHAITRRTRRLRGALRPMTRQYTGRNNLTISMPDGGSVPIVSQTEIKPMKTALSLMLALITTTALTEPLPVPKPPGPGGSCPHGYIASGSFCTPSPDASDAIAKPSNDTCSGDALRRARTACEMDARGPSLRPSPCRVASRRVVLTSARPSRAASRKAHGRASGLRR